MKIFTSIGAMGDYLQSLIINGGAQQKQEFYLTKLINYLYQPITHCLLALLIEKTI